MADTRKTQGPSQAGLLALLTVQEARLLSLIMGLLMLGLAVRFIHLRSDHSRVLPVAPHPERSQAP